MEPSPADPATQAAVQRLAGSTQKDLVQDVTARFHAATTRYVRGIMARSEPVRRQFEPSFYEALDYGRERPFEEGKDNQGIVGLERIYEDRAVLTPYFGCATYCRYCFKKTRTLAGTGKRMSEHDIGAAIQYIRSDPRITTVLITGGDPLAKAERVIDILTRLQDIEHVNKVRIGTRHILFQPDKITSELAAQLADFNRVNAKEPLKSKNISIGVSINHADELQPEVIAAVHRLTRCGITVRGQVVLMKGVNNSLKALKDLIDHFLAIGVVPYYLFHCMDVVGTYHMRTSVQLGLDLLKQLLEYSGTCAMNYVYVTPIGKHRLAPGHTLEYDLIEGRRYIRAVSPYRTERFLQFSGQTALPKLHENNADGYIVSRYLDGDDMDLPY